MRFVWVTTIVNRSILPGRDLCDVTDGAILLFPGLIDNLLTLCGRV